MRRKLVGTVALVGTIFVGGFAFAKATEFLDRSLASLVNGGDNFPLFLSSDFTGGKVEHLAVGETAGIAEGNDFAMARSDRVDISVIEKIPIYRTGKDIEVNARAVDLDGDGKADLNPISNDAVNFEVFKYVKDQKNKFGKSLTTEVPAGTQLKDVKTNTTFVILFVNAGKKTFSGTATLFDHLHHRIKVSGPIKIMGATDQRQGNAFMSMIPYLNLFTSNNMDFKWEERLSAGIFGSEPETPRPNGDMLKVEVPNVTVKPRQGIAVVFDAVIDWGNTGISEAIPESTRGT